jgi:PIN domain nuclease of toxin-antitoxin system
MRVLLDTHVFLWLTTEPERLGRHLDVVENDATELLVSAASSWEIAIKYGLGRLPLPEPPDRWVPSRLQLLGAQGVPVEHGHALAVAALPPLHRDPFDRLLVATSSMLHAPLLTADPVFAGYDIEIMTIA